MKTQLATLVPYASTLNDTLSCLYSHRPEVRRAARSEIVRRNLVYFYEHWNLTGLELRRQTRKYVNSLIGFKPPWKNDTGVNLHQSAYKLG
jgi:hypothetical protein